MMKMLAQMSLSLILLLVTSLTPAFAELGPKDGVGLPATDLERIKTGQLAPDFTLQNQDGKNISLSDYGGQNVVLVFYRGHW